MEKLDLSKSNYDWQKDGEVGFDDFEKMTVLERATYAADFLLTRGQTDGERHKMWVIDRVLRILLGNKKDYDESIEWYRRHLCSRKL